MKPFRVASGRRVLKSGHKDGLAGLQPHAEAFWDTFFVSFCAAGDRLQNAQRSAPAVPTDVAKIARKSFLRQFVSFLSISGFLLRRARSEIKAGAKKTVFDFYSALARYEIQDICCLHDCHVSGPHGVGNTRRVTSRRATIQSLASCPHACAIPANSRECSEGRRGIFMTKLTTSGNNSRVFFQQVSFLFILVMFFVIFDAR